MSATPLVTACFLITAQKALVQLLNERGPGDWFGQLQQEIADQLRNASFEAAPEVKSEQLAVALEALDGCFRQALWQHENQDRSVRFN